MEFSPLINFFLGFIASIGYYRLFFTINRPAVRWRFFVMLAVAILSRPVCSAWQFYAGQFQEQIIAARMVSFIINLVSLLACVLLGSNRLRAFVAAAFVLSISYVAYIPVIYTASLVYSLFIKFDYLDKLSQISQHFYLMFFIFNLNVIIMCSCFLAARWLRKTQGKPPLKTSVYFCLFFIFFTLLMSVFIITTWLWQILEFRPLSFLGLALLGTLLVCILNFAVYIYSRFIVRKEEAANDQDTARAGYAQLIGQLSRRELEVIEAILAGNTGQKELAASLNISVNTVKKHLQHIYQTTGAANMTALTVLFSGYSQNHPKG